MVDANPKYFYWVSIFLLQVMRKVFGPAKSINLTYGGVQTSAFHTFLERLGKYSFPKKKSDRATKQKSLPLKPDEDSAFTAHHLCHALRPLKLYLPLHRQERSMQ